MTTIADLTDLITLSAKVTLDPNEENFEAFLQAYNATQPPEDQTTFIMFDFLGEMTIQDYMAPECKCQHNQDQDISQP